MTSIQRSKLWALQDAYIGELAATRIYLNAVPRKILQKNAQQTNPRILQAASAT